MNSTIKNEWVKELRSGRWPQGTTRLVSFSWGGKKSYCVFAVLCEIAARHGVCKPFTEGGYEGCRHAPPAVVMKWAELNWRDLITIDGETRYLAWFNDKPTPFAVMADAIEEQW